MSEPTEKTVTVFRKWKKNNGGGIIALFPEIPADLNGNVLSYEHIGQHGGATYAGVIQSTRPATEAEYCQLLAELTSIGYDVHVCRRVAPGVHNRFRKALQQARGEKL